MDNKKDDAVETFKIQVELTISKKEMGSWLHTRMAEGVLPSGTAFQMIDIGAAIVLQHRHGNPDWTSYILAKDELLIRLTEALLLPVAKDIDVKDKIPKTDGG